MTSARWLAALLVLLLLAAPVHADGDDDDDDDDDEEGSVLGLDGEGLGEAAQVLLVLTLSIVVWKPLFGWLRKGGIEALNIEDARAWKKKLGTFNRRFMKVHTWIAIAMLVAGTLHGLASESHWMLWLAMALMGLLSLAGGMMQWKWPPKEVRKGARLLHMQRAMSVAAIVLLVVGHGLVD